MFKFSMQTLAYFSVCVLNGNRISEACMVCSLQAPTGHFGVDREKHKLFSQVGPTGRESYSMVCRLNSGDHAHH